MSVTVAKRPKLSSKERVIVAIIGGQRSHRMRNFGTKSNIVLPDGKTLLQHQIELVNRTWSPTEILVSAGYDADKIIGKRNGFRVIENTSWESCGEVEELRLILNCCDFDRLYVMSGDIFISGNLLSELPKDSWTLSNYGEDDQLVGSVSENGFLTMFSFSFTQKFLGVLHLVGNELYLLRKMINRERSKFALWELIEDYTKSGFKIKSVELNTGKVVKMVSAYDLSIIRKSFGVLS